MCLVKALWMRTRDLNNVSIAILSLDAKVLSMHPANLEHLLLTDKICFSKLQSEDINYTQVCYISMLVNDIQVRININIGRKRIVFTSKR